MKLIVLKRLQCSRYSLERRQRVMRVCASVIARHTHGKSRHVSQSRVIFFNLPVSTHFLYVLGFPYIWFSLLQYIIHNSLSPRDPVIRPTSNTLDGMQWDSQAYFAMYGRKSSGAAAWATRARARLFRVSWVPQLVC